MTRPEFSSKTKMAAARRAGFPDDFRCECGFGQPITKSDPAEYHHIDEAESVDPERRAYLRSLANCQCVRRSCHRHITATETIPKIVKSRRQREGEANIKRPKRKMPYRRFNGEIVWPGRKGDKP
jgi:hypothetical protein